MKTLMIVTGALGAGGLERISCFIANKFCDKGWRVVVLTLLQMPSTNSAFQQLNSNVKVIHFTGKKDPETHKKSSILTWRKMIKNATKEYNPDSILCMTFKIASMVCLFARRYAKRVTIREINDPRVRNRFVNNVTEILCRKVKNIIFQTNYERSCFHKRIREKGCVIPNPLSIDVKRTGKFIEKKVFTLSRLSIEQKRHDVLIKGFEIFHQSHPDYTLEIYGRGGDNEKILELIKKSSCPDSIKIIYPIPNVHEKIIDYRCFVMTSDFEGMSNALLECYSLGIPCVSSDWPGVEDILTNNRDGLLYKRQDCQELAEVLCKIASDDSLCKAITKSAIDGSKRFARESVFSRYCEVIERE